MRRMLPAGMVLLLLLLVSSVRAEDDPARDKVLRTLYGSKVSMEFEETPLVDVIAFVRRSFGLNITWSAEARALLEEQDGCWVSVHLRDLRLATALKLILDMHDLRLAYRDGVLILRTALEVRKRVITRFYDVRDLTLKVKDFPGPSLELSKDEPGATTQGWAQPAGDPDPTIDDIAALIQRVLPEGEWETNAQVSLQVYDGRLVLTHNREMHEKVADLLNRLRAAR